MLWKICIVITVPLWSTRPLQYFSPRCVCADARAGAASVNPQLAGEQQQQQRRCVCMCVYVYEEKSCGKPLVAFRANFIFESRRSLTVWDAQAPPPLPRPGLRLSVRLWRCFCVVLCVSAVRRATPGNHNTQLKFSQECVLLLQLQTSQPWLSKQTWSMDWILIWWYEAASSVCDFACGGVSRPFRPDL